ncbi:unnamed protein product [Oreochromis niloticus]|nr:unnamed protein product [Mustela putorius furo]
MLLLLIVSIVNMLFGVGMVCMPLSDNGPHIAHGWAQVVRLRHLYATRPGMHLLISEGGQIRGSACFFAVGNISILGLMEIRPVGPGRVVIRGVATARFLCIEDDGTLYSSHAYSREDCIFREQILPDGYNIYISDRHGVLLSLGNHRQRLQGLDRGDPALAQFLPRISTLNQIPSPGANIGDHMKVAKTEEPVDTIDSFGKFSQIIDSPSFHKR